MPSVSEVNDGTATTDGLSSDQEFKNLLDVSQVEPTAVTTKYCGLSSC